MIVVIVYYLVSFHVPMLWVIWYLIFLLFKSVIQELGKQLHGGSLPRGHKAQGSVSCTWVHACNLLLKEELLLAWAFALCLLGPWGSVDCCICITRVICISGDLLQVETTLEDSGSCLAINEWCFTDVRERVTAPALGFGKLCPRNYIIHSPDGGHGKCLV